MKDNFSIQTEVQGGKHGEMHLQYIRTAKETFIHEGQLFNPNRSARRKTWRDVSSIYKNCKRNIYL
jgi:hypothetical protein